MHAEHRKLREREVILAPSRELLHALGGARQHGELVLRGHDGLAEGRREAFELRLLVLEELHRVHHAPSLAVKLGIFHAQTLLGALVLAAHLLHELREAFLELRGPRGDLRVELRVASPSRRE